MDILKSSQLVIFSHSTIFITFSYRSLAGFLFKVRGGENRKWRWIFAFDRCVHLTSMSCLLEPAIWSRDTGQRIPCFDRCQLIIIWISNTKEHTTQGALTSVLEYE